MNRATPRLRAASSRSNVSAAFAHAFSCAWLGGTEDISIPISNAGAGLGGNAHAANEFYVIEGAGKVYGMAGAEKVQAAVLYNFAGKN